MGDQTELPNISKYDAVVLNIGTVTAAQVILRFWKNTSPDFEKLVEYMLETVSYKLMLPRVNDEGENFKKSWARFFYSNLSVIL